MRLSTFSALRRDREQVKFRVNDAHLCLCSPLQRLPLLSVDFRYCVSPVQATVNTPLPCQYMYSPRSAPSDIELTDQAFSTVWV